MAKIIRIDNVAYTERETLERKYTKGDAIAAAKVRLGDRPYCTNALHRRGPDMLTLPELNALADAIVDWDDQVEMMRHRALHPLEN